jgi:hypothetical protein
MTTDHAHPMPPPTPLCAIFAPLLPLYCWDELDAEQAESLRQHLADCDYCQPQLHQYEAAVAALRQHVAAQERAAGGPTRWTHHESIGEVPVRLTLEDIMHAANREDHETSTPTSPQPPRLPDRSPRRRMLTAVGALAAVLVVALVAASLFAHVGSRPPGPAAKPTPTLDPTTQAYLTVLQTYYVPWAQDHLQEGLQSKCGLAFTSLPPAQQTQQLPTCRPLLVPEIAAGKTLLAHLATAQPPTRWHAAHAALDQAMQAADAWNAQRLQAIDAQNVSQYVSVVNQLPLTMFCDPLSTFNAFLASRNAALLPAPIPDC